MKNRGILIVLLAGLMMSCGGGGKTAKVAVKNQSGWEIKALTVGISGQEKTIRNLPNGGATTLLFQGLHGSHYSLNGKLSNGTMIHGDYGYASNGVELDDSFVVYGGGRIGFNPGPH